MMGPADAAEPSAEPDDIFYQLDQELEYLEREVNQYLRGNIERQPFPHRELQALLQLKQFPALFRPAYKELLSLLPVKISLRSKRMDFRVPMTSAVDLPSTSYARFRCIYAGPATSSPQCETWTFIPYVQDTYLRGLAGVLGASANINLIGPELEAELAVGFKQMFCSGHDDKLKDDQAGAFAVACRPVIDRWRESEQLWRNVGQLQCQQTRTHQGTSWT
ncbi:uncharacterized protein MYCFIDRAFT_212538 [Pseudocercospora fijiensis CIRAD86]|uniref:Uncharacterized protein n=1 Tax=Pseudocercospora fijiensis (strain CIRAD86) TaxID=383855 RepID=M3AKN4_PSEFD|nr:uncharacterized protein MYCFIDRAFT_212538 [Pseudocercospora fijiensis CIRAD86]EME77708.1 hypothetical protein MYCFIDRAFT_212538 [Pseudocercospora fijiensis CIRAD86]